MKKEREFDDYKDGKKERPITKATITTSTPHRSQERVGKQKEYGMNTFHTHTHTHTIVHADTPLPTHLHKIVVLNNNNYNNEKIFFIIEERLLGFIKQYC